MNHDDLVRSKLFEQRTVFLRGSLDDKAAGDVAAQLMTLDATGDAAVTLVLDATGTTVDAAFTVMDVIDLLGVPVKGVCMGRADGAAVGVLAVCGHRSAGPNARFRLADPDVQAAGNSAQIARAIEFHNEQLRRFHLRLAQAVNKPLDEVVKDCAEGRFLDADQAWAYGLVDEIAGRPPLELRRT